MATQRESGVERPRQSVCIDGSRRLGVHAGEGNSSRHVHGCRGRDRTNVEAQQVGDVVGRKCRDARIRLGRLSVFRDDAVPVLQRATAYGKRGYGGTVGEAGPAHQELLCGENRARVTEADCPVVGCGKDRIDGQDLIGGSYQPRGGWITGVRGVRTLIVVEVRKRSELPLEVHRGPPSHEEGGLRIDVEGVDVAVATDEQRRQHPSLGLLDIIGQRRAGGNVVGRTNERRGSVRIRSTDVGVVGACGKVDVENRHIPELNFGRGLLLRRPGYGRVRAILRAERPGQPGRDGWVAVVAKQLLWGVPVTWLRDHAGTAVTWVRQEVAPVADLIEQVHARLGGRSALRCRIVGDDGDIVLEGRSGSRFVRVLPPEIHQDGSRFQVAQRRRLGKRRSPNVVGRSWRSNRVVGRIRGFQGGVAGRAIQVRVHPARADLALGRVGKSVGGDRRNDVMEEKVVVQTPGANGRSVVRGFLLRSGTGGDAREESVVIGNLDRTFEVNAVDAALLRGRVDTLLDRPVSKRGHIVTIQRNRRRRVDSPLGAEPPAKLGLVRRDGGIATVIRVPGIHLPPLDVRKILNSGRYRNAVHEGKCLAGKRARFQRIQDAVLVSSEQSQFRYGVGRRVQQLAVGQVPCKDRGGSAKAAGTGNLIKEAGLVDRLGLRGRRPFRACALVGVAERPQQVGGTRLVGAEVPRIDDIGDRIDSGEVSRVIVAVGIDRVDHAVLGGDEGRPNRDRGEVAGGWIVVTPGRRVGDRRQVRRLRQRFRRVPGQVVLGNKNGPLHHNTRGNRHARDDPALQIRPVRADENFVVTDHTVAVYVVRDDSRDRVDLIAEEVGPNGWVARTGVGDGRAVRESTDRGVQRQVGAVRESPDRRAGEPVQGVYRTDCYRLGSGGRGAAVFRVLHIGRFRDDDLLMREVRRGVERVIGGVARARRPRHCLTGYRLSDVGRDRELRSVGQVRVDDADLRARGEERVAVRVVARVAWVDQRPGSLKNCRDIPRNVGGVARRSSVRRVVDVIDEAVRIGDIRVHIAGVREVRRDRDRVVRGDRAVGQVRIGLQQRAEGSRGARHLHAAVSRRHGRSRRDGVEAWLQVDRIGENEQRRAGVRGRVIDGNSLNHRGGSAGHAGWLGKRATTGYARRGEAGGTQEWEHREVAVRRLQLDIAAVGLGREADLLPRDEAAVLLDEVVDRVPRVVNAILGRSGAVGGEANRIGRRGNVNE